MPRKQMIDRWMDRGAWRLLAPAPVLLLLAAPFTFGTPSGSSTASAAASAEQATMADAAPAVPNPGAELVSACADCHDLSGPGFARNPHLALNRDPALAARYGVSSSCEGCHGDGQAHVGSGDPADIFGFGDGQPTIVKSERCLDCHGDSHPRFFATAHAQAGLGCTSCHAIHADGSTGLLSPPAGPLEAELADDIGRASAACSTCHRGVMAQFAFNERHRLREGVLGCVDCHDSHEPSSRLRLGAFKQDACVTCHADKGGPFVFEHGAQRVDGCAACHTPHGSANRHMLNFQSVAQQCYSCHGFVPGFHTRFNDETICTNCHVTIHGSNFDAGYLR